MRSEVTVQVLLGGAPLGTVHTPKLLDIIVPLSVILQVGKLLEFLPADTC